MQRFGGFDPYSQAMEYRRGQTASCALATGKQIVERPDHQAFLLSLSARNLALRLSFFAAILAARCWPP